MRQSGDSIVVNRNKTGRWATAARSSFASDDKTQSEIDECSQSKGSGDRPPASPYWGHCYLLPERRVPLVGGWKWVMIELIKWSALVISHRECGFEAAAAEGHRTIEWKIWPNPTTQWGKSIALSSVHSLAIWGNCVIHLLHSTATDHQFDETRKDSRWSLEVEEFNEQLPAAETD